MRETAWKNRPRAGTHSFESRNFCKVREGTVERDAAQTREEARRFSKYFSVFERLYSARLLASVQLPSACRRLTCCRRLNTFTNGGRSGPHLLEVKAASP